MNQNFSVFICFCLCLFSFGSYAQTVTVTQYNGGDWFSSDCAAWLPGNETVPVAICSGTPAATTFTYSQWCSKAKLNYPDTSKVWRVTRTPISFEVDCGLTPEEVQEQVDYAEEVADNGQRCPTGFLEKSGGCYTEEYCDIGTNYDSLTGACEVDDCVTGSYWNGAGCSVCPPGTQCYQEPQDPCEVNPEATGCGPDPDPDPNPDPDPDPGTGGGSSGGGTTVSPGSGDIDNDGIPDNEDDSNDVIDNGENPDAGTDYTPPTIPGSGGVPTGSDGDATLAGFIDWLQQFLTPGEDFPSDIAGQTDSLRAQVESRSVNVDLSNLPQLNSSGFLGESCPADVTVSTSLGSFVISMAPICDLASIVRGLLIALVTYLVYMRVFYALVEVAS